MTTPVDTVLPAALNHLLAQESWARAMLLPHAGKVACFDLGMISVALMVAADGLVQAPEPEPASTAAVTIRVRAADLPLILQDRERAFSYVSIDGDAEFANTISQLSRSLRWEVADDLGKLVGDIAAQRIVGGAGAIAATLRSTQRKLLENAAEYFLEEQPLLVRPQAVSDLSDEVTRMRDDVERLAKRIGRLS
jgi:ubiquinone biosynthesis protein UbiJ